MNEFDFIRQYLYRQQQDEQLILGIGDDAAIIRPRNGYDLHFSTDMLIGGTHFFKGIIFKLTNNIVGDWLGRISYSLYLLHPVCIVINKKLFSDFLGFTALITYIIFISCISIITHLFIENKSMLFFQKKSIKFCNRESYK